MVNYIVTFTRYLFCCYFDNNYKFFIYFVVILMNNYKFFITIIVTFPWIFEYGNSIILELGIMGAKLTTVDCTESLTQTLE
jgi:hypothetical protein